MKTHWITLLEDDTPLPASKKQKLIKYLLSTDTSRYMMLLKSPPGYRYEKYIYDVEDHDSVFKGLLNYVEEYGAMWSKGILGAEPCSAFHDIDDRRKYTFLAPYFYRHNSGSIGQWAGVSSDFPNIGPQGIRDRGDAITVSELDTVKLFGQSGLLENRDILLARGRLEALAKAAWGCILLYGRSLNANFDSGDPGKVLNVKQDVGTLLGSLFSKSYNMTFSECMKIMDHQDLLGQAAREISYWMSEDYVKDLREGLIPEAVYPHYKGVRSGHTLAPYQAEFLSDDGFKGEYESVHLGGANGRNLLVAPEALIVKLHLYGCLMGYKADH